MVSNKGFTLIEIMIVLAIIAILAAIALPAYQDYTIRTKISEGLIAVSSWKSAFGQSFYTNGVAGLTEAAGTLKATPIAQLRSKYIKNITSNPESPWTISVEIEASANNGIPTILDGKTLTLSPNVLNAVPAPEVAGALDWACGSSTTLTAQARNLGNYAAGTLLAKYAPSECR